MIKKLISIIASAAIAVSGIFIPFSSYAAESDFTVENGVIVRYLGTDEILEIPSEINGEAVTAIGSRAFNRSEITKITIPQNITYIEKNAFYNCRSLGEMIIMNRETDPMNTISRAANDFIMRGYGDSVARKFANREEIPFYDIETGELLEAPPIDNYNYDVYNGILMEYKGSDTELTIPAQANGEIITKIGEDALAYKNLTKVTFPDTVTEIGNYALSYNNFTQFEIPDHIKALGKQIFNHCDKLEEIHIGSGLETIDDTSFIALEALKSIEVSAGNNSFSSDDGILFNKDKSVIIRYPVNNGIAEYTVNTSEIFPYAFYGCGSLTNITLSDNTTAIGDHAFSASGITRLEIGKNISRIGYGIASFAKSLKEISVDEKNSSYRAINGVLYTKDAKTLLQYPADRKGIYYSIDDVETVASDSMSGTSNLVKIDIKARTIEDHAFESTSAYEIVIADGAKTIGRNAFYSLSTNKLYIPDSVEYIDDNFAYHGTTIYCFEGSEAESSAKLCECGIEYITSIPEPSAPEENLEVSVNGSHIIFDNNTGLPQHEVYYIARYNDDGDRLESIFKSDIYIPPGHSENTFYDISGTHFLWDSTMKPLTNKIQINN